MAFCTFALLSNHSLDPLPLCVFQILSPLSTGLHPILILGNPILLFSLCKFGNSADFTKYSQPCVTIRFWLENFLVHICVSMYAYTCVCKYTTHIVYIFVVYMSFFYIYTKICCIYMCVCISICMCAYVCIQRSEVTVGVFLTYLRWVILFLFCFLRQDFSLLLELTDQLGWLARMPQGSAPAPSGLRLQVLYPLFSCRF